MSGAVQMAERIQNKKTKKHKTTAKRKNDDRTDRNDGPGMLYLFINNYLPMAGLVVAFKKYNYSKGIFGSEWCGLDNFKFLFSTKDAFIIAKIQFVIIWYLFSLEHFSPLQSQLC